jgi:hypothetical protein
MALYRRGRDIYGLKLFRSVAPFHSKNKAHFPAATTDGAIDVVAGAFNML